MKKLLVNIVCGFIVNDDRRRAVRRRMLGRVAAPQAPAGADKDAVELSALRENIKALQGMCGQTSIDMRAWINRNMEKKLSTALMHQKTFLPQGYTFWTRYSHRCNRAVTKRFSTYG